MQTSSANVCELEKGKIFGKQASLFLASWMAEIPKGSLRDSWCKMQSFFALAGARRQRGGKARKSAVRASRALMACAWSTVTYAAPVPSLPSLDRAMVKAIGPSEADSVLIACSEFLGAFCSKGKLLET